jgi:uncharacterized protein (TIGR02594 family)
MPEGIFLTPYDLAQRFIGTTEVGGKVSNPQILAMLRLDATWPTEDEVPWCSAFVNYVAWLLRLPRSKALNARSWLGVGRPVELQNASAGFDVVVFERGVDGVSGHVGFFAAQDANDVYVLGGNQGDRVCVEPYPKEKVLGVRRLV